MTPRLSASLRALLTGVCLIALAGCSSIFGKDDETNNANKDAANYRERSVEQVLHPHTSASSLALFAHPASPGGRRLPRPGPESWLSRRG